MNPKVLKVQLMGFLHAAVLWGLVGWWATIACTYSKINTEIPQGELKQQVLVYDHRILPKAILVWAIVGPMACLVVSSFYMTNPSVWAARNALFFSMVVGVGFGLVFALWYYPRLDLQGTAGSLASTPFRVGVCAVLCLLLCLMNAAFTIKRFHRVFRGEA